MTSPRHFAEHGALIARRTDLRALAISGPDRIAWLMGMITCDLSPVEQRLSVYGLVLDKQGKILSDLVALQHDERLLIAVDAAEADKLCEHLDHFLIMEDAEIEVLQQPHEFLVVVGPRAGEAGSAAMALPDVIAVRPGRILGTEAVLILVDDASGPAVADALASQDEAFGVADVEAFDRLRLEIGIPKFGVDFGPANYPMDAGLDEHAVSFSKGCYVGQEVVVKLRSRGKPVRVLRRLLVAEGAPLPAAGQVVTTSGGKESGKVTSAAKSDDGRVLAFALLRRADVEAVDTVEVGGAQARLAPAWGALPSSTWAEGESPAPAS